jgi:hypothetical protein
LEAHRFVKRSRFRGSVELTSAVGIDITTLAVQCTRARVFGGERVSAAALDHLHWDTFQWVTFTWII